MLITTFLKESLMIVTIEGRLDSLTSPKLELWIRDNLASPECDVVMDFSKLDYISSAGLRVMLNLSKATVKCSRKFSVCQAQDHIREVFEISGFDSFIPLYDSLDDVPSL